MGYIEDTRNASIARHHQNKKAYISLDEALEASKKIRKRIKARLKPYKCKYCEYYHLGHNRSLKRRLEMGKNARITKDEENEK